MIVSIRVDERLIHGQVALVWTKEFNTSHVVVANDNAASDDVQQMTLKMAIPAGVKLLVKSVKDAIDVFNDSRAQDTRIFVLTSNIRDALFICKECEVSSVNVANVGRIMNPANKEEQIKLNPQVFVNKDEMCALKELITLNIDLYHQVVPSNKKVKMASLI